MDKKVVYKIVLMGFIMPPMEIGYNEANEGVKLGATYYWIGDTCMIRVPQSVHKGSSRLPDKK